MTAVKWAVRRRLADLVNNGRVVLRCDMALPDSGWPVISWLWAYADASERVFDILHAATPLVEGLSLDEAFLDVTASRSLLGTAAEIAAMLRRRIGRTYRAATSPAPAKIAPSDAAPR